MANDQYPYLLFSRSFYSILGLAIVIFCWFDKPPLFAKEIDNNRYLNSLIEQSIEKQLAQKRPWHLLVHYRKNILGGYTSEADDPAFFNSSEGKTGPQAELIATLRSFFKAPEQLEPEKEHPQCNFPARYKWLKSELSIDPHKLPGPKCERLQSWVDRLDPEKITLIFASFYLNNPASMFGHTFLRIDKKRLDPNLKLLNYGTNYAADQDTTNAFTMIFKGLFGLFEGHFSLFPYFIKVQHYSNWESRDLWEYELSFTKDQMNSLLLHLWELGGINFNYHYFQENCSYHILSLLEVANPELHLTDQFFFSVAPTETIKVLNNQKDLISKVVYRPSLLSQANHKILQMSDYELNMFYRLAKDPEWINKDEFKNLGIPQKAIILDSFLDYSQYKTMRKEEGHEKLKEQTRNILLERSKINEPTKDTGTDMTRFSTKPDLSHGSSLLRLGIGRNDEEHFEEFSYRQAYHDLLANDAGYSKDSQILFFDMNFRYYNDTKKIRLDKLRFLDIISLIPYDPLFKKLSWKLNFGVDSIRDIDCNYCNSFNANYGIGITYKPTYFSPFALYSLLDLKTEFSSELKEKYRLGGGATVGILVDITDDWRVQVLGNYLYYPFGHESQYYKASLSQRYSITQDIDVRVELNKIGKTYESVLAFNFYF